MIQVVSVGIHCLSRHQGSSTQSLEAVRSHIASPYARERIHRLQISSSDPEVGLVLLLCSQLALQSAALEVAPLLQSSRGPSVVSSAPLTPTATHGAAARGPSFVAPASHLSLVRHAVAVGCVPPDSSWCSEALHDIRIYMHAFATGVLRHSTPVGASYYSFVYIVREMVVVHIRSRLLLDSSHSSGSHHLYRPDVPYQAF